MLLARHWVQYSCRSSLCGEGIGCSIAVGLLCVGRALGAV